MASSSLSPYDVHNANLTSLCRICGGNSGTDYDYLKGRNFRGYYFRWYYFGESKVIAFHWYLFSRITTDFLLISLFYADFDGISEKSTFRGYLISRNQQKFAKIAKISTRANYYH